MTPLDYLEEHKEAFRERLLDFLRIPSVSSLPEHKEDVARAGEWVATSVREAGLENVQILPTGGHPVVYGEWLRAPGKPTVLIYGHFDTQPVDPLNGWTHPPFAPVTKGDRVYARGASDDKGNMLAPILAVEALLKTEGKLPVNLKVLVRGPGGNRQPAVAKLYRQQQRPARLRLGRERRRGAVGERPAQLARRAPGHLRVTN